MLAEIVGTMGSRIGGTEVLAPQKLLLVA